MINKTQKLILNFLNLSIDIQDKIVKDFNDKNPNNKIHYYDINPLRIDKDNRLKEIANLVEIYQQSKNT